MVKCYKVSPSTQLYRDELEYRRYIRTLRTVYNQISKQFGIESEQLQPCTEKLEIMPTKNDEKKFEKDFVHADGFPKGVFKFLSPVSKAWREACAEAGYKESVIDPRVGLCSIFGVSQCRYKLLLVQDGMICQFESDQPFEAPDGFTEITKTEFCSMIEEKGE